MTAVIKKPIVKTKAISKKKVKNVDNLGKKTEQYSVQTAFTGKQITVSRGTVVLKVDITDKVLLISGRDGKEFVFKNANKEEVVQLWDGVIGCLSVAIGEIKKQRKL
jgi:hypothetical protein